MTAASVLILPLSAILIMTVAKVSQKYFRQQQEELRKTLNEGRLFNTGSMDYESFMEELLRDTFVHGFGATKRRADGYSQRIDPEEYRKAFNQADWDYGREYIKNMRPSAPPPPRHDPRVMNQLLNLKRMRDGTTFDGERANAQAAMDRIMAKHGISEGEI